jgi:hypothetical protein
MKNEREILEFQVLRNITGLYKSFLNLVEDLSHDHNHEFKKLKEAMPEHKKILTQAEYLDEAQLNFLRKKILDMGNDCRREIFTCMENFEINIKK